MRVFYSQLHEDTMLCMVLKWIQSHCSHTKVQRDVSRKVRGSRYSRNLFVFLELKFNKTKRWKTWKRTIVALISNGSISYTIRVCFAAIVHHLWNLFAGSIWSRNSFPLHINFKNGWKDKLIRKVAKTFL